MEIIPINTQTEKNLNQGELIINARVIQATLEILRLIDSFELTSDKSIELKKAIILECESGTLPEEPIIPDSETTIIQ